MRKVTSDAIEAFTGNSGSKSFGNTTVVVQPSERFNGKNVRFLKLHGNIIAQIDPDGSLCITSAGWRTNTTKERLNGLPNVYINQKKGVWHLNGKVWDGNWIKVN